MGETNVILNMADDQSRRVAVEIVISRETVEIRCAGVLTATVERRQLNAWFANPAGPLDCGKLVWLWNGQQYRFWVRHLIPAHPLAPTDVAELRRRLASASAAVR